MSLVSKITFTNYQESVAVALDMIGAGSRLPDSGLIIIKPNLTNADAPPVTTHVDAVEAVYQYCKANCKAEIAIGEGCGSGTTKQTFDANGYTEMAEKYGLELIDFNEAETVLVKK